jgi:hypothetical protein
MEPRTTRCAPPSVLAVVVRVPWDGTQPHPTGTVLAAAIRAALSTVEGQSADPDADAQARRLDVVAIGPNQINRIDDALVTVTYPAGATTVMSVQPDGTIETRPQGSQGAYERAILGGDRLVFAPIGPSGKVFLVPYADTLPNPE